MMGSWDQMMGAWGSGGWIMMSLGMILWTVAIVLVVWLVVRGLTAVERRGSTGLKSEAEDLLRRRFASGEIDAEEYERRLAVLRG